MVIKNKDGSEYTLRKPNPIMKTQNLWDEFEIHNMNFNEIIDQIKNHQKKTTILDLNKEEIVIEDRKKTEDEPKKVEIKKILETEINQNITKIETEKKQITKKEENPEVKKTIIHCLPAKVSIKEDNLYGDIKKLIKYEDKFTFEAAILDISDFEFIFWTNIEISKESIIYPKNSDKRWWKITGHENKFNGYIFYAKPSDVTPNFED